LAVLNEAGEFSKVGGDLPKKVTKVVTIANATPTLFYLKPYRDQNKDIVQDAIFCATKILVA
jgi:hypothetical protein